MLRMFVYAVPVALEGVVVFAAVVVLAGGRCEFDIGKLVFLCGFLGYFFKALEGLHCCFGHTWMRMGAQGLCHFTCSSNDGICWCH